MRHEDDARWARLTNGSFAGNLQAIVAGPWYVRPNGPMNPAHSPARARKVALSCLAIAYVLASAWQVAARRDDWPLSKFGMYSGMQGRSVARFDLVAVSGRSDGARIPSECTRPLGGSRLRWALRKLDRDRERRTHVLDAALDVYAMHAAEDATRCPPIDGLRVLEHRWSIRDDLSNVDRPTTRVAYFHYRPPPEVRAELEGPAPPARPLPSGDLVIDAADATVIGAVRVVSDARALRGRVLTFDGALGRRAPSAAPADYAELTFESPRGLYGVWLRGVGPSPQADSVWLEVDGEIGRRAPCCGATGFGNWQLAYPARGLAWSSLAPAHPPGRIALATSGTHWLRLYAREPGAAIDQVWLRLRGDGEPRFTGPLVRGGAR